MKKAIQIAYDSLFEKMCNFASEAGFKYISVNFHEIPLGKTEDEWKFITEDIQRVLSQNNLQCIQTHLHYHDPLTSSEITLDDADKSIKQEIIAASKLGSQFNVYHPRTSISSGYRTSKALEDNRKILTWMLDLAIKHNTSIACENIPIFPTNCYVLPFYSSNVEDLVNLVDSFNDEHMVACWDFGHANLMKWDQATCLRFLGSRLKCTHIHNNYALSDDHAFPDSGLIKWEEFMPTLSEIGFDGPLTSEVAFRYKDEDLCRSAVRHLYCCLEFLEKLTEKEV